MKKETEFFDSLRMVGAKNHILYRMSILIVTEKIDLFIHLLNLQVQQIFPFSFLGTQH